MTKEQEQLVTDNIRLVYWVINRQFPTYIYDEDIVQTGMLGLCMAANAWDGSTKFSHLAVPCIRHAILNEFTRRRRTIPTLSLDYDLNDDDGGEFGDYVVADDDSDFIYSVNFSNFRNTLSDDEINVLNLLEQGLTGKQAADELGISHQRVNRLKRQIYLKWRKYDGNN